MPYLLPMQPLTQPAPPAAGPAALAAPAATAPTADSPHPGNPVVAHAPVESEPDGGGNSPDVSHATRIPIASFAEVFGSDIYDGMDVGCIDSRGTAYLRRASGQVTKLAAPTLAALNAALARTTIPAER